MCTCQDIQDRCSSIHQWNTHPFQGNFSNVSYRNDACTCMYTIAYMQQLKVMVSQLQQRMDSLEKQNVRILALVKSVRDQQKKTERDQFRIDDSPFKFSYSDLVYTVNWTSDSGPSEIGTQYLQRTLFKVPKIGLPMVLIHFEPPRRGQPLYKGRIYIVPKVSFVWRFDCIYKKAVQCLFEHLQLYIHYTGWATVWCCQALLPISGT